MRVLSALLTLVCLASSPALASGDVGVVVVGEPTMQPALAAQLEAWLRQHGHQLKPSPLPPDAINTLIDCFVIEDELCARRVVEKRSKTQAVVFARVDLGVGADGPGRTVTLTAYWFDKGRDAIAERRFCERCTDTTLRSTADELMAALAVSNRKEAGKIKVSSSPRGARVLIDGNPIGVTPLEFELEPGTHKVSLSHADHRPDTRDVMIRRGETTAVDVVLESQRSQTLVPAVLIGSGVALLATGIILVAIDEDEPPPTNMTKEHYRNTGPFGVGLSIGGLVVGGIGGYLLFRSKRESAPVASVTSDTAMIGWAGQF